MNSNNKNYSTTFSDNNFNDSVDIPKEVNSTTTITNYSDEEFLRLSRELNEGHFVHIQGKNISQKENLIRMICRKHRRKG